jgi:hypothetical protein
MVPRLLLLTCVALGACLAGRLASAATDYLIVERWCLLDKPAAAGSSRCSLGWSTVTVRSLVNPLNG